MIKFVLINFILILSIVVAWFGVQLIIKAVSYLANKLLEEYRQIWGVEEENEEDLEPVEKETSDSDSCGQTDETKMMDQQEKTIYINTFKVKENTFLAQMGRHCCNKVGVESVSTLEEVGVLRNKVKGIIHDPDDDFMAPLINKEKALDSFFLELVIALRNKESNSMSKEKEKNR